MIRVLKLVTVTCLVLLTNLAKSNPTTAINRQLLFKRARSLDNGVNISWFEQTWNPNVLKQDPVKNSDYMLLQQLGFKCIRLPVAFNYFETANIPAEEVFARIDQVVKRCKTYGFKLIIDYHYGTLNDNNYVSETNRIINTWLQITKRYKKESRDFLFFDIYNEPPRMNPQIWKDAAYNIVTAIHKIDPSRTLIVGASDFNNIDQLNDFVRLADENVIYTFHFYEPFLFTHQGAGWIGNDVATVGVPFPYTVQNFPQLNPLSSNTTGEKYYNNYKTEGTPYAIYKRLRIAKNWSDKYYVPVICAEYGVYNKYADQDSRCRYIKTVRNALKSMNLPGILWDYNANFSIFNGPPSIADLPVCMQEAIGYKPKRKYK